MAWARRRVAALHSEIPMCLILPSLSGVRFGDKVHVGKDKGRVLDEFDHCENGFFDGGFGGDAVLVRDSLG